MCSHKISKYQGGFKENISENTLSLFKRICAVQVKLYFSVVARITGIRIMPTTSVLKTRELVVIVTLSMSF